MIMFCRPILIYLVITLASLVCSENVDDDKFVLNHLHENNSTSGNTAEIQTSDHNYQIMNIAEIQTSDHNAQIMNISLKDNLKPESNLSMPNLTSIDLEENNKNLSTNKPLNVSVDSLDKIYTECGDSLPCTQGKIVEIIDLIDKQDSIPVVIDYVTLDKTSADQKNMSKDSEGDSGAKLVSRMDSYLKTHSIRLQVPELGDSVNDLVGRLLKHRTMDIGLDTLSSQDEGEARTRVKRLIIPLLLLFKLKLAILLPIFISVITLVSFKGLWAGLAAMLVSSALGLKQLIQSGNDNGPSTRLSLGVVKPHIIPDVYHGDYYHGWSRSGPPSALHDSYPYRGYYSLPSAWRGDDRPMVR